MKPFVKRFGIGLGEGHKFRLLENPFTDRFTREEIDFYDLPSRYRKGSVRVELVRPMGRLDDYLNSNWRGTEGDLRVPALWIDGRMWMSLTFMEVQSAYVPLAMTDGIVGTAGLGLGYFALRAASNPDVEEVHVYEQNPDIIRFFMESFRHRPEMDKIRIHEGDVRKLAMYDREKRGPRFDTFFMDVYRTMLPDEVISDILLFEKEAVVQGVYRFWGQERVYLDAILGRVLRTGQLEELDKAFLRTWKETPFVEGDDEEDLGLISEHYAPQSEQDYQERVLEALGML